MTIGPRTAYSMALTRGLRVSIVSTRSLADVIDLVIVAIIVCGLLPATPVVVHMSLIIADITRRVIFDEERPISLTAIPAPNTSRK